MVQPQMSQHSYTYGYVMILYAKEMEISSTKIKATSENLTSVYLYKYLLSVAS